MTVIPRSIPIIAMAASLLMSAAPLAADQTGPLPGSALAQFNDHVSGYVALRSRFEEPLPRLGTLRTEWSTLIARRYLASAIRTARHASVAGEIFTPQVALMFRERFAGALTPNEWLLLVPPGDDESAAPIVLVNEPVAEEWFTALPPALVQHLPALPEGIEYRFVGTALVLWDTHAEIVIDVLPNAAVR
jgi:hypothetical protein